MTHPNQALVSFLAQFNTIAELEASTHFAARQASLQAILNVPQVTHYPTAQPCLRDFLRVVCWNIERGNNFDGVRHFLRDEPRLATADLLLLNELDVGMVRTGNRHVANELGAALGYHVVYVPEYLELTKGVGEELKLPGENTTALHGNAILSRYPISPPRLIDLPVCFEHFEFAEKRYGRRIAIVADIDFNGRPVTAITAHLEVRNTPACRARQLAHILRQLREWQTTGPVILAGDFNTNGFARGSRWRTMRSLSRVLLADAARLQHQLIHPDEGLEPLFEVLKEDGFNWWEFNSAEPTTRVPLDTLEESAHVPVMVQRWIQGRLARLNNELLMRLDWICGREVRALAAGEMIDRQSGLASIEPQTLGGLRYNERPVSDHAPIVADVIF